MAQQIPQVQASSYENLLGDMINTYLQKTNINDLRVGSVSLSLLETVALAVARSTGDIFQIERDLSVDRATGEALQRIAADENLTPIPAQASNGTVTFFDTSFTKVSAKVYAGTQPPVVGASIVNISSDDGFPASGSVIIGRGTPNVETLPYSSIIPAGSYFELNLTTPTTQYHNINETVILSQGGARSIPSGTAVSVPATGVAPDITFSTTAPATILDGETEVLNVPVVATTTGAITNAVIAAITNVPSPPFSGAGVTNPLPFTSGRDQETDAELRIRIKRKRLSIGLGTANAIKASVIGATAQDQAKTIVDAQIAPNQQNDTILYVDDGQGYESTTDGVGVEPIVDQAYGGETNFQLQTGGQQANVSKAFLISANQAPFDVVSGDNLAVSVGGDVTQHQFQTQDFQSQGAATAYEIVASINADPNLDWEASTQNGGSLVKIQAKANTNEDIQIAAVTSGRDAAAQLQFGSAKVDTLRLYRNKQLLNKDGITASVDTASQSSWSPLIATGDTLIIAVDNTAAITYTFTDADFVNQGTYPTVSSTNSLESWIDVINAKITGATATSDGDRIKLTSNRGRSDDAAISISSASTLVSKNMFQTQDLTSTGQTSDYEFSPNTAQIRLSTPLLAGDELSAGLLSTEARLTSQVFTSGSITIGSGDRYFLWIVADDTSFVKRNLGLSSGSTITVSIVGEEVTYTSSSAQAFANCFVNDYVVIHGTVSGDIAGSMVNRLEGRINSKTNNSITLKVTVAEAASASAETVPYTGGFEVFKSLSTPQKFNLTTGTKTLSQIASELNAQTSQLTFFTEDNNKLVVQTRTRSEDGAVVIAAVTDNALTLQFPVALINTSSPSQIAFYQSGYSEGQFPSFIDLEAQGDSDGNPFGSPIANEITQITVTTPTTTDPNKTVVNLQPYNILDQDALQVNEVVEMNDYDATDIFIKPDYFYKRIRDALDRIRLAEPLSIAASDNLNVILNKDSSNQLFSFNLYRNLITESSFGVNNTQFNAKDKDNGASPYKYFGFSSIPSEDGFFTTFDFDNFAILMQAKKVVLGSTAGNESSLLIRASEWGRSGEYINIGYVYPSSPNQTLGFTLNQNDKTNIRINLQSGATRTPPIQQDTEWDVTSGGGDDYVYTWNSIGSDPAATLATLVIGDFVNISPSTLFSAANQGVFRVKSFTTSSFTIENPIGTPEANIPTAVINGILFYEYASTTAADVNDFINNGSLSDIISSTIVDDGGTTGAGEIELSTYENSGFAFEGYDLLDGINWISTYDPLFVGPNFTLKRPLSLASDIGYEFQDGESCRLVPTTIGQLTRFLNIPAVSALSLAGDVEISNRDGKLQIATDLVGSDGAIQVVGGPGNTVTAPIQANASLIYTPQTSSFEADARVYLNRANLVGFISDQYVKLQAALTQAKTTNFDSAGTVTIAPNQPSAGQSLVTVTGNLIGERYFGNPRGFVRSRGVTYKVEKHGLFTCITWNQVAPAPDFFKALSLNDSGGGQYTLTQINSGEVELAITSGNANFKAVDIGDQITIAVLPNAGSYLVTGVSPNGKTIRFLLSNATQVLVAQAFAAGNISATGSVKEGDTVTLTAPFNVLNQGSFRVIRANSNNEIWIDNADSVEETVTDTYDSQSIGYNSGTNFVVTIPNNDMVVTIASGSGSFANLRPADEFTIGASSPFLAANQGTFQIKSVDIAGNAVTLINPAAVAEATVTAVGSGTSGIEVHRPAIKFFDYDATVTSDMLMITSNFLGSANQASWMVLETLGTNQIVIDGIATAQSSILLGTNQPNFLIQEQSPYVGYKRIRNKYEDPTSLSNGVMIFDTYNQYVKINSQAQVTMSPMNKLNFSTQVGVGLDAYRYFTGLVGEANRVVYGSPTDTLTYPGVAAAGAEIFIREPLIRRVQVGIDIRIQTGIPFLQVVQQVRQNVTSLVNSNPIGQPIAISDIVSTVNAINGVTAVAISSPLYNSANSTINVGPAEKAKILNVLTDVLVNQIVS